MCSPQAHKNDITFTLKDFFHKLKAMNGNHAADCKKTFRLMGELKTELGLLDLGTRALILTPSDGLSEIIDIANKSKIEEASGIEAWNAASPEERDRRSLESMNQLKVALGQDIYDKMSENEKRTFDLFLWAGCCMHKDLNAVKGGSEAMKAWWAENDVQGPILLTNWDNTATLANIQKDSEDVSPAQRRAIRVTEAGGVKTTLLASARFNHSNDKKGLQDTHIIYFQEKKAGRSTKFPDTSTTRYGSNIDAAAELLLHLDDYIAFMEDVRDKKEKQTFNNLEANLYKALKDPATRAELTAMTFYGLSVSYPYARRVRGPGTENVNILDLGPFHEELKTHIQLIIDQPELLLGENASFEKGTLDGKEWFRPDVFAAV